jgi:pimeloyl-ACP methyl ester carboxylesterase
MAPLPIILLHGIGSTRAIWKGWEERLAIWHPCHCPDLRGYGSAAKLSTDKPWRMADLVADLIALLDAQGIAQAHLVGESVGGTVVLAAAISHPDRVASVTMSNAGYRGGGITNVASWREILARDGMAGWNDFMMRGRFGDNYASDPALDQALLSAYKAAQGSSDPEVALALGEMLGAVDLSEGLKALKVPLLVLQPDASPFVPLSTAAEIKALQPRADICVFPGVRHGLPLLRPDDCVSELLAFYARQGF